MLTRRQFVKQGALWLPALQLARAQSIPMGSSHAPIAAAGGPVLSGLMAEFRYDDGSGQVLADYSGLANHGQRGAQAGADVSDFAWVTEGADFDGSDDFASIPLAAYTGEFTITIVFFASTQATSPLIGASDNSSSGLLTNTSAKYFLRIVAGGSSSNTIASPSAGTWEAVTIRRNAADKIDLFRNDGAANRLFGDVAQSGTTSLFNRLGRRAEGVSFDSIQAAALFYTAALADAEITTQNYPYLQALVSGRGITLP